MFFRQEQSFLQNIVRLERKKDASQKVLVWLKKELRSRNLTNNLTKRKLATDKKRTLEKTNKQNWREKVKN